MTIPEGLDQLVAVDLPQMTVSTDGVVQLRQVEPAKVSFRNTAGYTYFVLLML